MNSIYILPARARGPSALIISASAPRAPAASLDAAARTVNVFLRVGGGSIGFARRCRVSCSTTPHVSSALAVAAVFCVLCVVSVDAAQQDSSACPANWEKTAHLSVARWFPAAASLPNQGLAIFAGGTRGL